MTGEVVCLEIVSKILNRKVEIKTKYNYLQSHTLRLTALQVDQKDQNSTQEKNFCHLRSSQVINAQVKIAKSH